jgi:cyclic beta-1,2-glucan synthetase
MESGLNLLSSLPRRSLRTGAAARSPIDIDPDEAPLQADLFSVSQLERHARALAVGRDPTSSRERPADRLLPRLDANERALAAAYVMVTEAVQRGRRVTPAAEWFVDNFHLIEEQIRTARRHLPRVYSRELPRIRAEPAAIVPRVYDLILEFISHSHGRLDVTGLRAFVASYQGVQQLRLGELWAIPIMLRLALLENLRRVVGSVTRGRREREAADTWVERMTEVAASAPGEVVLVLAEMVEAGPPRSISFLAELASRLQRLGSGLDLPMTWLEQRLAERGLSVEQVFQLASQSQAIDQVAVSNSIGSLRLLDATDWRAFVEASSLVEQRLAEDPAGVYSAMDFATRDRYRHVVEAIARRSALSEAGVAEAAVTLARAGEERRAHVGYFLVDAGRVALERATGASRTPRLLLRRFARRFRLPLYIGAVLGLNVAATWGLAAAAHARGLGGWALVAAVLLLAVATSQLATAIVQWAATLLATPSLLPRLDFSAGIPAENNTVVAVPTLLCESAEIDGLLDSLEVRYLANRDLHLSFALLSDLRDAPREHMDGDDALLARARDGVQALNARYRAAGRPAPFYLFHRARRWNPREGVWMGWERKRGKLEQFNEALRGATGAFSTIVGDARRLSAVKYVICLDSDTQLPRGAARELVGIMAHPLNRPRFDPRLGRVVEGYAILQPRVAITMLSARRSGFARLFAGEPGIDPYTRAVSDVYQDVFDEGSFVGKGIYDVDAFQRAIGGKLPENRILSHDLLEGAYARSGLVSDVLLFEDYPAAYSVEVSRRHRWTRGDWQLLAWLGHRVPTSGPARRVTNPISLLSRWKIADNLRRSLVPLALLALLVLGWVSAGFAGPVTAVVLVILVVPGLLSAATGILRRPVDLSRRDYLRDLGASQAIALAREAFALVCLPHDARVSASAIIRAAARVFFTGRRCLEWRTASDAERGARYGLAPAYRLMSVAPLAAVVVAVGLFFGQPGALPFAAPLLLAWALAPALVWWLSRPTLRGQAPPLAAADQLFLRRVARRTWRFFEAFVGPADNHLPPDNYQVDPPQGVAHRTSPTNIGLALTANLAAYDFGYVEAGELLERSARTMATMERLERYRGHFYNWYDTRTLEPLRPTYISTVDSGNLTGHLRTLVAGLGELEGGAIFRASSLAGLADTLAVLIEVGPEADALQGALGRLRSALVTPPSTLSAARTVLERLRVESRAAVAFAELQAQDEAVAWARLFAAQIAATLAELELLAPWIWLPDAPESTEPAAALAGLDVIPTLRGLAALGERILPASHQALAVDGAPQDASSGELERCVRLGASRARARLAEIQRLRAAAAALAEIEVEFLYDRERHLLAIGYNVADHRRDAGFYDLLASEARLASFVAIADGKLPPEHWFRLGRSLTTTGGGSALLSWSGSMFEYLMPLLLMPTYRGTLLDETCRSVVERQIEYGRERGVPWGVSESGYIKTDAQLNYQYRAFGVPGLGFKRGLAADLVIAPYASAMALMIAPRRACENLRRLELAGLLGPYGFYEAIDYTPARLPRGEQSVTVASYMAHHQGMAFLSLVYLLEERPMQRRFAADPAFRATDLLLQERVPRTSAIYPHPAEVSAAAEVLAPEADLRVFTTANTPSPEVQLLSNGTYHVMVTNAGGGYSRWRDLAVTRWREDPTCDGWGGFCYLRDVDTGDFWSTTHQPSRVTAESYEAIFSQGRAEFRRHDREIETHVEICVSPEDDVELRRVCLTNRGAAPRTIELTSFAEIVLAKAAADTSHPAFSNLFVETELLRDRQAILCTRRPRSGSEAQAWVLHLMTVQGRLAGAPSYETGRAEFLGRGRSVGDPQAMHRPTLSGSEGAVLDPVVAIRSTVALDPDETACIDIVTGVAETRAGALALIDKYSDRHAGERALELSWTHSQVLLRRLDASAADTRLYQRLASHILYSSPALRAPPSVLARNQCGQSSLWAYGISGDLPIALLRIGDRRHLELARHMVQAHAYFRLKGLAVDLLIWNDDPSGYRQALHEELLGLVTALSEADLLDRPGGVFVRRTDEIAEEDKVLQQTVARLIISDTAGSLDEQLGRLPPPEVKVPELVTRERRAPLAPVHEQSLDRADLRSWNGRGGFTPDGREYVITTSREAQTPAPWVNVLANPHFGAVVSESGAAYTWCENAHSYRLTPWSNDPVSDASGEALFLRDEHDGRFWSPTPAPAPGRGGYTTRHGFGYSVFEHQEDGVVTECVGSVYARDLGSRWKRVLGGGWGCVGFSRWRRVRAAWMIEASIWGEARSSARRRARRRRWLRSRGRPRAARRSAARASSVSSAGEAPAWVRP